MGPASEEVFLEHVRRSVLRAVPAGRVGVAFSGGVDSTLVSVICSGLGHDVVLLTVGFAGSHDLPFSRRVNRLLGMPHDVCEINYETFPDVVRTVLARLDTDNLSWIENCIAFYYLSRMARDSGLHAVVTANGIDEMFCGYSVYLRTILSGTQRVADTMRAKVDNELNMMKAINSAVSEFGVRFIQPLLSDEFIEYSMAVPLYEKIAGPDDQYRKHIVRRAARAAGVPSISYAKKKKAMQYGSLIHKKFLKAKKSHLLSP